MTDRHALSLSFLSRLPRLLLLLVVAFLSVTTSNAQSLPSKPNIIYIMADDLGYGDLGCYGQQRIQTPQLDRLAKQGMKLTSYYAGNTVCRPSRLVLWTGRHAGSTAINSNAAYTMQQTDTTVAERLQQAGYVTGGVGKWACGTPGSGGEPVYHGFDFWMGYLDQSNAHNYYPTHLWRCADNECQQVALPGNVLMDHPQARGRVAHPEHRKTYSHDVMTDEALRFIRRNHKQPFLLHIHWTIPHANNEGGRVTGDGQEVPDYGIYADQNWPDVEKGFAAMVTRMDSDVGRIVDLLQELGIDHRTLVIFTSDNGPHNEGEHDHKFFDSNGPLRGYKRDLYEGGIRVPTIAWWPNVIQAGTVSDEPLAFYDFLPTACALAETETPAVVDGLSFLPTLLSQPSRQPSHEYLFWKYGNKVTAVRQGKWKFLSFSKDTCELYDLSRDIGETTDVHADHPEIVRRLREAMRQAESG